jgi:hypothetical protein
MIFIIIILYNSLDMDYKECKTRQEKKNIGKHSTKYKETYNSKRVRGYQLQMEKNALKIASLK